MLGLLFFFFLMYLTHYEKQKPSKIINFSAKRKKLRITGLIQQLSVSNYTVNDSSVIIIVEKIGHIKLLLLLQVRHLLEASWQAIILLSIDRVIL